MAHASTLGLPPRRSTETPATRGVTADPPSAAEGARYDRPVRVAVLRERAHGERRVALVPDAAARLRDAGIEVAVESGAGAQASADDDAYRDAGAAVLADRADVLEAADVVLRVGRPSLQE